MSKEEGEEEERKREIINYENEKKNRKGEKKERVTRQIGKIFWKEDSLGIYERTKGGLEAIHNSYSGL